MKGTLYICATPIGNLGDISFRALEILREVDLIAAEDTRHTQKLLNHYEINTATTSYHEHNRFDKADVLVNELLNGKSIALVSDAGTPAISDPGEVLVQKAIEAEVEVVPIPGPTALIAALTVSGLPTGSFHFEGFIPRKKREREAFWEERKHLRGTLVFYEAPHRLLASLKDLLVSLGDRRVAVARELTKRFEEVFRGRVSEALNHFSEGQVRGELVIVVEGAQDDAMAAQAVPAIDANDDQAILDEISKRIAGGKAKKEAIKEVAQVFGLDRNMVYKIAIAIKEKKGGR